MGWPLWSNYKTTFQPLDKERLRLESEQPGISELLLLTHYGYSRESNVKKISNF